MGLVEDFRGYSRFYHTRECHNLKNIQKEVYQSIKKYNLLKYEYLSSQEDRFNALYLDLCDVTVLFLNFFFHFFPFLLVPGFVKEGKKDGPAATI